LLAKQQSPLLCNFYSKKNQMEENQDIPKPGVTKPVTRPPTLSLLCILTFIGSLGSAMSSFFIALAYNIMPEAIVQSGIPEAEQMLALVQTAGRNFFILFGGLNLVSFAGALMMWKLNKKGFHVYTLAQLLMLTLPLLMINGYRSPWSSLLLTATFIFAYAINTRFMK